MYQRKNYTNKFTSKIEVAQSKIFIFVWFAHKMCYKGTSQRYSYWTAQQTTEMSIETNITKLILKCTIIVYNIGVQFQLNQVRYQIIVALKKTDLSKYDSYLQNKYYPYTTSHQIYNDAKSFAIVNTFVLCCRLLIVLHLF